MKLIHYADDFSHQVIDQLLDEATRLMEEFVVSPPLAKKVYAVLEECMMNNIQHVNLKSENTQKPFITLNREGDAFKVSCGNVIEKNNIDDIRNRIDTVNRMSKEELKEYYKLKMRTAEISEKGGAGLGIITIAKLTNKQIYYIFEPIDNTLAFMTITIYLE